MISLYNLGKLMCGCMIYGIVFMFMLYAIAKSKKKMFTVVFSVAATLLAVSFVSFIESI